VRRTNINTYTNKITYSLKRLFKYVNMLAWHHISFWCCFIFFLLWNTEGVGDLYSQV